MMTNTDRAFIRAYSLDRAEEVPSPPHLSFSPSAGGAMSVDISSNVDADSVVDVGTTNRHHAGSRGSDAQRPGAAQSSGTSDISADTSFGSSGAAGSTGTPLAGRRSRSGQSTLNTQSWEDGRVTRFVPAPHMPTVESRPPEPASDRDGLPEENEVPPTHSTPQRRTATKHRQPLSTIRTQMDKPRDFSPLLAVDRFVWPRECQALLTRESQVWEHACDRILAEAKDEAKVIAVASGQRGEGRKTVLLCLAKMLIDRQVRTALVDADFQTARLGARLGLGVQVGWENVLAGGLPLAEAVISAEHETAALLPLCGPVENPAELCRGVMPSVTMRVLRGHFDVVLVELGPLLVEACAAPALSLAVGAGLDCAVVVRHASATTDEALTEVANRLSVVGVPPLGVIENSSAVRGTGGTARRTVPTVLVD